MCFLNRYYGIQDNVAPAELPVNGRNRDTDVENKLLVTGGKAARDKLGDWD